MSDDLFSRDEVLGGFSAGRARTLLFLIESRTAHLVARSRRAMELRVTERGQQERDLAFLEAFSMGKEPPLRPTVQDLERYTAEWSALVPDNPRLRAAVANALGSKYVFAHADVPGMRGVLGLDGEAVQQAYEQAYRKPIATIYAPSTSLLSRARWRSARFSRWLETRPPFWTVYSLTLTETVGAGILALPLAVAGIGPVPGLILLLIIGTCSTVTLAAEAEAVTRNGLVRYGAIFFRGIVAGYLGRLASLTTTVTLALFNVLVLIAYYFGVSSTLNHAIGIPSAVGVAALFLIGIVLVSRDSLNATIASALMIGACSIILIILMSAIAFSHFHGAYLTYHNVPFIDGKPFEPGILGIVFGVIISAFFGHLSVVNTGGIVLQRDSSGRSLLWGGVAAQLTALVLYTLWVLAVNGAVPHAVLTRSPDTALVPLATSVGGIILLFGSVFACLAMGMGSIHMTLSLRNLASEWIPSRSRPIILLPRLHGELRFGTPEEQTVTVVYRGSRGDAYRFGVTAQQGEALKEREEIVTGRLDLPAVAARLGVGEGAVSGASFAVLDGGEGYVRVQVSSPRLPAYEGEWAATGAHLDQIFELDGGERALVQWLLRHPGCTLPEIAAGLGQDESAVRTRIETLISSGAVETMPGSGARYRAHLGRTKRRQLPQHIWEALDGEAAVSEERPARSSPLEGARTSLANLMARHAIRGVVTLVAPALVFLATEWLLTKGQISFAGPIGFVGVVAVSILGGVYPSLLLITSRRKGEYVPGRILPLLKPMAVVAGLYVVFVMALFVHAIFIWQSLPERAGAFAVGVLVLATTVAVFRGKALNRRAVVEIRVDHDGHSTLSVVYAGQAIRVPARARLAGGDASQIEAGGALPALESLDEIEVELPAGNAQELEVWAHRVGQDGESQGVTAQVETRGEQVRRIALPVDGRIFLPLSGLCLVAVVLPGREPANPKGRGRTILQGL